MAWERIAPHLTATGIDSGSTGGLSRRTRVAVLISGGGTTLLTFLQQQQEGRLPIDIPLVIASRPDCGGVEKARKAGLRCEVVSRKSFSHVDGFSAEIFRQCREVQADLVTLAGFLCLVRIPEDYRMRVMNVHPALVPAFAGLGAPDWDGHARGTVVGLTRGTTRAHLARSALEAIALQVADVFDAMGRDSGIALKELRVDGGACRNNLLMQMQADFLGVPVVRPRVTETTALGAAYLAGLATGLWRDAAEISAQWQVDRRFEPQLGTAARRAKLTRWRQAVERSKAWADN